MKVGPEYNNKKRPAEFDKPYQKDSAQGGTRTRKAKPYAPQTYVYTNSTTWAY